MLTQELICGQCGVLLAKNKLPLVVVVVVVVVAVVAFGQEQ